MKTQSAQFGEAWGHVRDNYVGLGEAEARELFHICQVEYMPPSKAHRKRLAKPRPRVIKAHAKPDKPQKAAPIIAAHNQGKGIAAINGAHNPAHHKPREKSYRHVFSAKHCPLTGPRREAAAERNKRRNFYIMLNTRRVNSQFRPSLDMACDIFAIFGSWKAFEAACR